MPFDHMGANLGAHTPPHMHCNSFCRHILVGKAPIRSIFATAKMRAPRLPKGCAMLEASHTSAMVAQHAFRIYLRGRHGEITFINSQRRANTPCTFNEHSGEREAEAPAEARGAQCVHDVLLMARRETTSSLLSRRPPNAPGSARRISDTQLTLFTTQRGTLYHSGMWTEGNVR